MTGEGAVVLTVALACYAALAGVTFARLTRYADLIERRKARLRWLAASFLAALLWPLTWLLLAALVLLAKRGARG